MFHAGRPSTMVLRVVFEGEPPQFMEINESFLLLKNNGVVIKKSGIHFSATELANWFFLVDLPIQETTSIN